MSAFQDQLADHVATTFVNADHFGGSFVLASRASADVTFAGVLDQDKSNTKNTDESNRVEYDARILCVTLADYALLVAAVADFEKDGWIEISGERFGILGTTDRDAASLTLLLASTRTKALREQFPHGAGRALKSK